MSTTATHDRGTAAATAPPRPSLQPQPRGLQGLVAKRVANWDLCPPDEGLMRLQMPFWNIVMDHYFRMEIEGVFTLVLNGDKGSFKEGGKVQEMTKEQLAQQKESQYAGWVTTGRTSALCATDR